MKVEKVGQLDGDLNITGDVPSYVFGQLIESLPDGDENTVRTATIHYLVGNGPNARTINLEIPLRVEVLEAQNTSPQQLAPSAGFHRNGKDSFAVFLFKNKIYITTTNFVDDNSEEEATLLVKKAAYSEDSKLNRLRQDVDLLERVVERKQMVRASIPDDVKLFVFARDEGRCIRCGSSERLQFDHVIPVAKGGGNSEKNIQLLCDHCNLEKSDRISF